jgi:cell wall-associated NlpC family hydrolase
MTSLVERYADPIRTRLHQLTDRADLAHRTQSELRAAATTVADQRDQLKTRSAEVTAHWQGKAAEHFDHQSAAVLGKLTTTAETLAAGYVEVQRALAAVSTGHATIQRLLDQYTAQGNQILSAALKLVDAGQHGALIGAAAEISKLAGQYTADTDTAYRTAHAALTSATTNLTALEFPAAPKKPHHNHHHPANVQVHIGHGLGTVTAPNAAAATAVRAALSQLGVPYVWGGESPGHAFDCSGLTAWAYGRAGISLPHFASSQRIGKKVSEKDLAPGDLVIFSGHVTMYLGNGHVVAAPHTGTDVQIEPLFTSIPGDPFLGFYRPSVRA